MSDILAKMQAAHSDRKTTAVDVPEYGITLYFSPLTLADRARIRKGVSGDDDVELMVNTMIHKARLQNGEAAFADDGASRKVLYDMEVSVLQRIMAEADPETQDEPVKNA
ncbi:MAG: hypothetical protein ABJL67_13475 [Sulfitobacter sp.]